MSFYKSKKFQQYKKKDMFEDHNTLRFFLSLHFGDVVDKETLVSNYNLTTSQINNISQKLQEKGYVIATKFSNLDENMQLSLLNGSISNPGAFYEKSDKIQVYAITGKGKEKGKEILKIKLKESQDNESIHYLIKQVSEYTKNYRGKIRELNKREDVLLPRLIEYPTKQGKLLIQRNSYAMTERNKQLANSSKSTSLVSSNENRYLQTVTVEKSEHTNSRVYESSFNQIEETLEAENKEIHKEITKSIEEDKKRAKMILKENEMYWTNKNSLTKEENMYLDNEANNFLESLGK